LNAAQGTLSGLKEKEKTQGELEQEHHEEAGHDDEPDEEGKQIPCGSVRVATHHG
jgi:hypothetical protein